ncbi:MAG: aminotransferase class V-fold PLP-dependent enzyme [Eubacteriales bacterium]|nr:aminotransferase class V-fold PLP-dependent enzyme [Eubacteriales bacterium]
MIYLDNAATSLIKPPSVIRSMNENTLRNSVNAGRGGHIFSRRGAAIIAETADALAHLFNISNPERIAFTSNATLALNMAILGTGAGGGHIIVTSMEHNSVLRPVNLLGNYTMVQADSEGFIDPDDLKKAIKPDTVLIICTHASNVSGSIEPIAEIGKIAREHNLLFLVDAAQSAGVLDIDTESMMIDLLAFSGHKGLLGPLGTGGLYVGERARLTPFITGGTGSSSERLVQPDYMPDMLHSGTLNTPAIAALGTAVKFIKKTGTDRIHHEELSLAKELISHIEKIEGVQIIGTKDMKKRNGTVSFTIDGMDSQAVAELLSDKYGIAVRGGWHCAYQAHKTLGTAEAGVVRASFGIFNKKSDAISLANAVREITLYKKGAVQ